MTASASRLSGQNDSHIPTSALLLGWAGVIPFAAGAAGAIGVAGPEYRDVALALLRGYGVAILSFMAGVQWGLGMMASLVPRSAPLPLGLHLGISVVPALIAWAAIYLQAPAGLLLLAVAFGLLLAFDLVIAARGVGPRWYRPLRLQLSAAAIASLLLPLAISA